MHIPDRYLSPETYGAAYAVMVPVWVLVANRVKKTLKSRQVPLLALGAAFIFVIMMFNIPIPFGSTGHAVGAVLVAVLLGPSAACIAVTIVLTVQALLFGDGGITALAANCFNIAVVMPFTGYAVYRLIAGKSDTFSKIRPVAAGIAGYVGLNLAAITTAVFFGIQPLIATDASGHAKYAPYPLKVALTAMAAEHLLVFGFIEAVITAFVIAYLQKTDPSLLSQDVKKEGKR